MVDITKLVNPSVEFRQFIASHRAWSSNIIMELDFLFLGSFLTCRFIRSSIPNYDLFVVLLVDNFGNHLLLEGHFTGR